MGARTGASEPTQLGPCCVAVPSSSLQALMDLDAHGAPSHWLGSGWGGWGWGGGEQQSNQTEAGVQAPSVQPSLGVWGSCFLLCKVGGEGTPKAYPSCGRGAGK